MIAHYWLQQKEMAMFKELSKVKPKEMKCKRRCFGGVL
jgi:hypothetical protein